MSIAAIIFSATLTFQGERWKPLMCSKGYLSFFVVIFGNVRRASRYLQLHKDKAWLYVCASGFQWYH